MRGLFGKRASAPRRIGVGSAGPWLLRIGRRRHGKPLSYRGRCAAACDCGGDGDIFDRDHKPAFAPWHTGQRPPAHARRRDAYW